MRSLTCALAVLGLLSVAACDSGGGGGGGAVSASQLYETNARTFCEILASCPQSGDSRAYAILAAADKSACPSFFATAAVPESADKNIETLVANGRIVFNSQKLNACLAAAESSCTLDIGSVVECQDVFVGTVEAGGACEVDEECAGDSNCAKSEFDCPGVCKPLPKRGEACPDFECSQTEGRTTCSGADACVAVAAVVATAGQPCSYTTANEDIRCASGNFCGEDGDGNEVCQPLVAEGAPCTENSACPGLTFCLEAGNDTTTCQSVTVVNTAGAACNETGTPFMACNVMKHLSCVEGKCKAWGDGSLGSYCPREGDIPTVCQPGNYCAEDDTCQPKLADGAACESSSDCVSGSCSFGLDGGTCGALVCE